MSEKRTIFNMAPTIKQRNSYNDFRARIINFSRTLSQVNSIDALIEAKNAYLKWFIELKTFLEKEDYIKKTTSILLNDEVVNHSMSGGVGTAFGDERSTTLLDAIEKEVENKILRLDKLYYIFDIQRVIEKHGDKFYYNNNEISLGKYSNHYNLLDVIYSLATEDGFVSYKTFVKEFKIRKKAGFFFGSDIKQKTVSNALTELFHRARLTKSNEKLPKLTPSGNRLIYSDRKRGGLILNNEIIS